MTNLGDICGNCQKIASHPDGLLQNCNCEWAARPADLAVSHVGTLLSLIRQRQDKLHGRLTLGIVAGGL